MSGYNQILLSDMIFELGEEQTKKILSRFSCPKNPDVEKFLKNSAIVFSKQGIAATKLVFTSYKGRQVLVGYYTYANKSIIVEKSVLSRTMQAKLKKFSTYDKFGKRYTLSAPLLAQLSKNFYNGYDSLITGDELIQMALNNAEQVQMLIGGKVVYLECQNIDKLIDFYQQHGFVKFGTRTLSGDERKELGESLVQMLRYRKG